MCGAFARQGARWRFDGAGVSGRFGVLTPHFALLLKLARTAGLPHLSMSNDYQSAIAPGATHLRIGSAIFGERI